jgi:hypothetical protein
MNERTRHTSKTVSSRPALPDAIMTTGADDHDRLELVSTIRRNTQAWVSAATPELRLRGEIPFEGIEAGLHVLCNRGWKAAFVPDCVGRTIESHLRNPAGDRGMTAETAIVPGGRTGRPLIHGA